MFSNSTSENLYQPTPEERAAFADEVWSAFLAHSGSAVTRLMSPSEYAVLRGWIDAGIPLAVILRGITDTKRPGRMLGYYNSSVQAAYEQWRKAVA